MPILIFRALGREEVVCCYLTFLRTHGRNQRKYEQRGGEIFGGVDYCFRMDGGSVACR